MGVLVNVGKLFARGSGRRRASVPGLAALFALGAAAAFGCGWFGTEHSVRFNGRHDERRFGRLPPLPFDARERTQPDYRRENEGQDEWRPDDSAGRANTLWSRAEGAARLGDFAQLREHLVEYLKAADPEVCRNYYGAPEHCRLRRNSALDQLDTLDSLGRGAHAPAVGAYLSARRAYDDWLAAREEAESVREKILHSTFNASHAGQTSGQTAGAQMQSAEASRQPAEADGTETWGAEAADPRAALDAVPRDPSVADNVAYLRAALLSARGEWGPSIEAFERLAARYPQSEKREAALLNAGLLWMKGSGGGRMLADHAAAVEACPECRDEAWAKAVGVFARLLREHPRGRYTGDARGWLAYLHVRVGARAEGLVEYYRMLADERDGGATVEALRSLSLVRGGATEEEMLRVESLLEGEPRVALAYAYHEIYNATLDDGPEVEVPEGSNPYLSCRELNGDSNCSERYDDWERKEYERRTGEAERSAFGRVAAFATRLMRRLPGSAVGGGFALRVAQAQLELGDDRAARELTARGLRAGLAGNERASALWVRGVAEYRLKDFAASRRTFAALLAEFPEGDLSEGARRFAAMAAEEEGDLEAALEEYLVLEYEEDVAYFVDVLLTPERLAAFIERRGDSHGRDMLLYSLGVRYMRARRFDEARAAFARVRTDTEARPGANFGTCQGAYAPPHCADAKNPRWQDWKSVQTAWVLRDLKTMEEIEHLEGRTRRASGGEAQAEALYQLASYLYESGDLTFYNPAAWSGTRFYSLYYDQRFRAPGEAALMRRYMEEHEPLVRALRLYLQVSEDYPRTRAARDSLYTAAVIHERLAGFELYWPEQYRQRLYPGGRLVGYADVRRAYPDYRLPSGTYGWEPSTRTVYGRGAWPAPPKPRQLTGLERARLRVRRVERRVAQAWGLFGEVYGGRARAWTLAALRWTAVALFASFVLFVFRRTRRARRFLYRRLARHGRAPRAPEVYAPKSSYAAYASCPWSEGPRSAASRAAGSLLRVALHERGRAALALNLFTHGLLTALLWTVLWAMRGGGSSQ